ncbi:MAG TPA: GPR1/FUN34/YaaH family transporter [Candidatus Dormibacteraeota bacterium]|nr:GPR1/FUN34/YaaH family transporter [Candidatus Dormibacteraeota bacterium]
MAEVSRPWGGPRSGPPPERTVAAEAPVARAEVGDATPLGLVAFGISIFTIGTMLAGWWPTPASGLTVTVPLLIFFGGVAQFIAAMWCYARGQTLPATFFGVFGSLFAISGLFELIAANNALAIVLAVTGQRLGLGMLPVLGPLGVMFGCFGFVALFIAASSASRHAGVGLTSLALAVALFFLAWAAFAQGNHLLSAIAGWAAVVSGFLALVTAAMLSLGGPATRMVTAGPRPGNR